MTCDEIRDLLPDYFAGGLDGDSQQSVARHIHECIGCNELVTLWHQLGRLPAEQPSPMLRARFEAMLAAYQAGQSAQAERGFSMRRLGNPFAGLLQTAWFRGAAGFACAAALLAVGYWTGSSRQPAVVAPPAGNEIAALQSELASMRQLVVLSLLQQQSASERLQGVSYSAQAQSDPKVLEALLHTLRYDTSDGVRLAALDALARHGSQPMVRSGLLDALQPQQSPLVQVALIDQLVAWRDKGAVPQIRKVQQNPELNPVVRKRAEWAIGQLH